MKIIIKKTEILNGLKFSNNIIGQNIIYPILQSVLIIAKNNEISLICSNGITSSKFTIKEKINIIREGKILIKNRTILNIISKLDDNEILLEKIDNSLLKINSSKFESNLNILNVEEFPNIKFDFQGWDNITINSKILNEVNRKVSPSANYNIEKDTVFNGILFDSESEENFLKIVASDTYKMSHLKFPFDGSKINLLIEPNTIKNILEFAINSDVSFYKKDNKVIILFNNIIISTKNIEGTYPNIAKIINQESLYSFKINKIDLQNLLNRGHSLIINESKPIANFKINKNDILISFKSIEIGYASESIEIESDNLSKIEFNINILFLNSLLKSFENNEVFFYILDVNKPILIKDMNDKKFIQILVPLRKH